MNVKQLIINNEDYTEFGDFLLSTGYKNIFLVCGQSLERLPIGGYLKEFEKQHDINLIRFSEFQPNPRYESVVKGIEIFQQESCEAILAIGGGSAMDVAKCIKLFCQMDKHKNYLKQEIIPNNIELIAVPTTAGTGSEATRYAVIYYNDEKQSVSDYSSIPTTVVFDASTLNSLPSYQRKVTMLDALCHAIESFWSVNSTEDSKELSKLAITDILKYMDDYLENDSLGNIKMLEASNTAGKAINITQTTAGHAMCYKLTSLYGIAHGHAAALSVAKLWGYMLHNTDKVRDVRGEQYFIQLLQELAEIFNCPDSLQAVGRFEEILKKLEIQIPVASKKDILVLRKSVNSDRLKNHPLELDEYAIETLYYEILNKEEE